MKMETALVKKIIETMPISTLIRPPATFSHPMGEGFILWDDFPA
jgi:hypothetical protein